VSLSIKQYILRLEIPVSDALLVMQEFEDETYFSGIELGGRFVETP